MRNLKENKGITLVALVITIIILLILAGVTIAQLTGNGLFEKAKEAKQKSENAQELENTILADYEGEINEYVDGTREQITVDKDEYEQLKAKVNNLFDYSNQNEKVIGTWYDGKTMYEVSIPITMPSTSTNGTYAYSVVDLSQYNPDILIVHDGYVIDSQNQPTPLPVYLTVNGEQCKISVIRNDKSIKLMVANKIYNGASGYVTLHYTKSE